MTVQTVACQAPLSIGFPREEYWNQLPFPSPGHLANPRIELISPSLAGRFFTAEPPGKPPVAVLAHFYTFKRKDGQKQSWGQDMSSVPVFLLSVPGGLMSGKGCWLPLMVKKPSLASLSTGELQTARG